jgi:hypothetical protein
MLIYPFAVYGYHTIRRYDWGMISTVSLDIWPLVLEGLEGLIVDKCHPLFAHGIQSLHMASFQCSLSAESMASLYVAVRNP